MKIYKSGTVTDHAYNTMRYFSCRKDGKSTINLKRFLERAEEIIEDLNGNINIDRSDERREDA